MIRFISAIVCCTVLGTSGVLVQASELDTFSTLTEPFLQKYCLDCHGSDTQEGEVAFHELRSIDANNAELWKRIWEQVVLREMPPADASDELPSAIERLRMSDWITGGLQTAMKDQGGFHAHESPAKANHLDHELLFGPIPDGLAPPSTPARIWRIHPQEHLTRLSALINRDPEFNPRRPGLRTRGDHVPPNQDGEVKVYFGLDRVIGWVGGSAAYAAAITGFPPILHNGDHHGLRSYANQHSVNGAEATQIANVAEDILKFMAYGPDAKPYQFAEKVRDIDQKYKHESLRGLAQSLFYSREPQRPLTPVYELMKEPGVSEERLDAAVNYLFHALTCRPPTDDETQEYLSILKEAIDDLGKEQGALLGLVPIFLDREALFRTELAAGEPDAYGRVMLQGQELALAINAAFSYLPPDDTLQQAVREGRLKTRDDVEREVVRILHDDSIRKPRILQFFREYFDYERAGHICKDTQALLSAGGDVRTQNHYRAMFGMTANTDRLVELILQEDKHVLRELLTTDRVVFDPGKDASYFGQYVSDERPPEDPDPKKRKRGPRRRVTIREASLPEGGPIHVRVARVVKNGKTKRTLTTLPGDQRMGILTHPSWLVSHSDAMDNHAILRGRWIRERLLGGAVPDVPITVDAMLPDEPKETLRHRMRVTREEYCWKCHQKMDPLGMPFEMYNHIGLYRTEEHGKTVDTSGQIIDSGEAELDGPVDNALELVEKLANSQRVEQVFVRHAFRFWLGRNETINDAPVLQDAWRAYRDHGGSMKALIQSLVTSDAYLYRTPSSASGSNTSQIGD